MGERFRNWSGSLSFEHDRRARPSTESDLRGIVYDARANGRTVRPVGSGHSSVPLVQTSDVLVDFEHLSGLREASTHSMTASLLPGTPLEAAGEILADHGLGMENLGDVAYQTVAGAVSTGTHGTGRTLGNMSSTLVGGRLVIGTGEVVPFGTEAGTDGTDDLTRAAQVALGSLGMFSSLTLRVLDRYQLHRRNVIAGADWMIDHFTELLNRHRHVDFYWYPRRDEVKLRIMDRPDEAVELLAPVREVKARETGQSHQIITNARDLRFEEMEYMFPLERGMEIFEQVRQRIMDRHRHYVGWRVLVRSIAPDNAMLSNCNAGPTMTIALLQNHNLEYAPYFDDLEPLFLEYGGRPHWGKKHSQSAASLRTMYPEWDAFHEIRRRLDPDAVFMNDYLRTLFDGDDGGAGL